MLTGLSVSWGIFILIVLLGAGNGLSNGVRSNFNARATNSVQLWSGKSSMPYHGLMANRTLDFSDKQEKDIDAQLREPDKKSGIIDKQSTVTYQNEYGNYSLRGVDPSYKDIFNLKFEPEGGRFINQIDLKNHSKVVVIDKKIAEVLFKKETALGKYVKVGSVMFRVIGINSKKEQYGNPTCYIPFTTAQLIYNPNQKFGSIAMIISAQTIYESAITHRPEIKSAEYHLLSGSKDMLATKAELYPSLSFGANSGTGYYNMKLEWLFLAKEQGNL